jgi:uridine kinase
MAFRNEYDFDSPEAIDFDILVERLKDIKAGYGHRHISRYQLITY